MTAVELAAEIVRRTDMLVLFYPWPLVKGHVFTRFAMDPYGVAHQPVVIDRNATPDERRRQIALMAELTGCAELAEDDPRFYAYVVTLD